ncbi:MAG: hypothetical protein J2O48_09005, partial [Solirubrobacterales bacterium]|nr:hypothetical protein [Solirubrobacterales bacterium]
PRAGAGATDPGKPVPVYRAEVVGSLLRPPALQQSAAEYAAGRISASALVAAQEAAILAALRTQADCGLDVCTDGEMRRRHFADPLLAGLNAFGTGQGQADPWRDNSGAAQQTSDMAVITEKLISTGNAEAAYFDFANAHARLPVKVTIPSPTYLLSRWKPEFSAGAYPDPSEMFQDSATILAGVVADLVAAGCRYIQFDAPDLTAVVDPSTRKDLTAKGVDPDDLIATACSLINQITEPVDPAVKFAVHLCRGNLRGMWRKQGGYEALSETFFNGLTRLDTFMLEFDDERSGSFECLAALPPGKVAVLGLVTTKRGELEPENGLVARIEAATAHVSVDQLAISTQCGFASTAEGNPVSEDDQRRKLELVARVAQRVWP